LENSLKIKIWDNSILKMKTIKKALKRIIRRVLKRIIKMFKKSRLEEIIVKVKKQQQI
jgi:hypothetical protein